MKRDDLPALDWRAVFEAACAPFHPRRGGTRWAWHWARGKLGRDPVFRHLVAQGLLPHGVRWLDIGCGQGLVASLLHAAGAAPAAYTGIELMQRDADRARAALQGLPFGPVFVCADMRQAPFPACDAVVILDVLHYVDHAAQDAVLARVAAALAPGGRLLLRVGDASQARGFAASQWVDRLVTAVRGHRAAPTWGRTVPEWAARLQALGFAVAPQPMSRGTPFANVLLSCTRSALAP